MFRNNFFHKSTVGESETPSLLQKEKRRSAKSDVSKVLFPELAKITNLTSQLTFRSHEISCSKLRCVRSGMTPVYATKLNNNNPVQLKPGFPLGGIFRAERLKMERFD